MNRYWEMEVFAAAVEHGSFSAAARHLDTTPSTVSKLIQRLENRLGVRLVLRSSRSLRLTQEGETYYKAARRVIEEMTEADNSVGPGADHIRGVLRVHSILSFAKYQLAPRMPHFMARHPHVRVEFLIGSESVNLTTGGIDIAIQSGEPTVQTLHARRIGSSRWIVCAAPDYLQRHGTPQTLEELRTHNCLNFTMSTGWNEWPFRVAGESVVFEPRGTAGSNQGEMLLALARAGVGIVRHAEFHVADDIRSGRLVPLLTQYHDDSRESLYALYSHRRNLSPRVSAFLQFLVESFGNAAFGPGTEDGAAHCEIDSQSLVRNAEVGS